MESPSTRRKKSGCLRKAFRHRPGDPVPDPFLRQNGLPRGDTPCHNEGKVVIQDPDETWAAWPELDPALAFQGVEPGVNSGFMLYIQ